MEYRVGRGVSGTTSSLSTIDYPLYPHSRPGAGLPTEFNLACIISSSSRLPASALYIALGFLMFIFFNMYEQKRFISPHVLDQGSIQEEYMGDLVWTVVLQLCYYQRSLPGVWFLLACVLLEPGGLDGWMTGATAIVFASTATCGLLVEYPSPSYETCLNDASIFHSCIP